MLRRRSLLYSALAGACLPGLLPRRAQAQGSGTDYDVLIIGAGVAGLATAAALRRYDPELKVLVLEARDRLGGRVHSVTRRELEWSVELGARYLNTASGADWPSATSLNLMVKPVEDDRLRLFPGMDTLVRSLAGPSTGLVQLNCAVTEVLWRRGLIGVYYRNRGLESAVTARRCVCTLPAALLREAGPRFTPRLPQSKVDALQALSFESLINVALLLPAAAIDAGKLDNPEGWERQEAGAWLRAHPEGANGEWLLEAQYSGSRAMAFAGQKEDQLCALALGDFTQTLDLDPEVPVLWQAAVDWYSEPFSREAKTLSAAEAVHREVGAPLENTLFFAGEATAASDKVGSLQGAFNSGERVALEVADSLGVLQEPEPEDATATAS